MKKSFFRQSVVTRSQLRKTNAFTRGLPAPKQPGNSRFPGLQAHFSEGVIRQFADEAMPCKGFGCILRLLMNKIIPSDCRFQPRQRRERKLGYQVLALRIHGAVKVAWSDLAADGLSFQRDGHSSLMVRDILELSRESISNAKA